MGAEAVPKSKPIDLLCPALAVSWENFTDLYWSYEYSDRYFHVGLMVNHGMIVLWNWDSGSWWYSEEISAIIRSVREGVEMMERIREHL